MEGVGEIVDGTDGFVGNREQIPQSEEEQGAGEASETDQEFQRILAVLSEAYAAGRLSTMVCGYVICLEGEDDQVEALGGLVENGKISNVIAVRNGGLSSTMEMLGVSRFIGVSIEKQVTQG